MFDLTSPAIPTQDGMAEGQYDPMTVTLRDTLNAQVPYVPTTAPSFPVYVRSYGPGIGDSQYNVGYKQLPVDPGILSSVQVGQFESPDVPVTHLPYTYALYNSTLIQPQRGQVVIYAMRAPGINEGVY